MCLTTHHQRTSGLFVVFDREIREKVVQERMEKETPSNQSKPTKKQKKRERENKKGCTESEDGENDGGYGEVGWKWLLQEEPSGMKRELQRVGRS